MLELSLISIMITVISATVLHWRYGLFTITKLNVLQVLFLSHILVQLIPSFIIAMNEEKTAAETYFLYCALATALIPLGGVLADGLLQVRGKTEFYRVSIPHDLSNRKRFANFFLVYLALCILIFLIYVSQARAIPIYDLIFGLHDVLGHQQARRDATSSGLLFGIALRFFMPLLFLIGVISRNYFVNRSLRAAAILAVLVALTYNAWPGSKTPVATLFLMAVFCLLLRTSEEIRGLTPELHMIAVKRQRKSRKRTFRVAIAFSMMVVSYPIFVFMFLPVGQLGIGFILESVFLRIFFKPAESTYAAFELFQNGGYTYFADISRLASLLNIQHVPLSQDIAVFRGLGEFTNAPPAAIGNFYAQGGGLVVVFGVTIASFTFKLTENIYRQMAQKTVLTLALYAILLFGAFRFSWANFHTMIMSEIFMPMVFIWLLWTLFGKS